MKVKPPRQAQEWSYSSHRESIGKALSSPDIRYNKKGHINCGSSARMAGNVCANVDQIRRQEPMEQHNDKRPISHQPTKRVGAINGRLSHICSILFILHVSSLTHLPASARSCSWRSANDMTD
ncbi:hypothetical protein [Absidia glauca]|uniref:Ndc10 domain-containing protein n=1 Tax=Absidia glauca TaxID=4829 RepID=A0A168LQP0_ABSGL|nr:hypothetical protein [Absidia glauca]